MFDAVVELHAMDEKMFTDFLIGKWRWIVYVTKAYLVCDLTFTYVVEAFVTSDLKALYKHLRAHFSAHC